MTDPVGLTIFSDGLNLDLGFNPDEANRLEEQEELEDQQRRQSEIRNQLQNAFDDLLSDDNEDTTIDGGITTHSTVDNSDYDYQPSPQRNQFHHNNNQIYQKQMPLGIKQSSASPAAQRSPQPPSPSAVKIVDQESEIIRLKNELACDKRRYEQHVNDLKKHIMKVESELTMAEAGRQQTHELLVESKSKCSDQEHFIQTQKTKIKELQANVVEQIADIEHKNTIISDLQHKYDFVEKQSDNRNMEIMLKRSNETYQAQTEKLQQQIQNLQNKIDNKDSELNAIFARYNELQKTHTQLVETQLQHEQTIAAANLVVAKENWNEQRQNLCTINEHQRFPNEIKSLKRHIYELENQLDTFKINEKNYLIQINKNKDDFLRLTNDIKNLNIELEKKNNILNNMNTANGLSNVSSPNISLLPPPPPPPPQVPHADLTESSTQTDLIQQENHQLLHKKEIDSLNEKLFNAELTIQNLNKQINLLQTSDNGIIELKEKAAKFEDFIQKHLQNSHSKSSQTISSSISSSTSPIKPSLTPPPSSVPLVAPPATNTDTNTDIKPIQTDTDRILTQIFASKIKSIEQRYQIEINHYLAQIQQINDDLNIKNNECELLKHAILSERTNLKDILDEREQETKQLFDKLYFLLDKCRHKLEISETTGQCLSKRIEWYREQYEKQQKSLKTMLTEWSVDKTNLVEKEQKLQELEREKNKLIDLWQTKYKSAKKTAASYKKYAEDKDIHIANENERIKCAYENLLKRVNKSIT